MNSANFSFEDIMLGQKTSFTRKVKRSDITNFARLSGDKNPLHLEPKYAKTTAFKKPIAHGMFLGSLCSRLVGMHLPGKRALYVSQSLEFKKPVYVGDTLMVDGVVVAKSVSTRIIELSITFHTNAGLVAAGIAKVKVL